MALDPNIILQGRSPNLLNSMAQGAQLASMQNDMAQQSQMRNFLRDNGQAVFQGDPQALGQLAQYDPQGAVNIDSTRQRLTMARQQAARQAAAEARNLSAAEAQEAAARIERAVAGGLQAQSPEQWDAFVRSAGAENLVGQFENRELIAAQYLGVKDALEAASGPSPEDRYKTVGNTLFDLYAEGGPASVGRGVSDVPTFSFNQTPEGGTSVEYGPRRDNSQVIAMGGLEKETALTPGGIEIVPGSTIAREATAGQVQKAAKDEQSIAKMGTTLSSIQLNIKEIEDGGLPVTGVFGQMRQTAPGRILTGESAVDVQNRSNQVTDAAALAEIQRMRDNSKTGGAVGQLTDSERVAIGNAVTALSTATSPQEYLRAAKAYRKLSLDLAFGEGNWKLDETTGTVTTTPSTGRKEFGQMQIQDLQKIDPMTLGTEDLLKMNQRLRELGY